MGREIERKFLVRHDGWRAYVVQTSSIQQAYLSKSAHLSFRVRIRDGAAAVLTIKSAAKELNRAEFEYGIPVQDARDLMALSHAPLLEKTRHDVLLDGLKWEVDVFGGRHQGLIIAEVELPGIDHTVALPDWVGEEVTGDQRFYNEQLAQHGVDQY